MFQVTANEIEHSIPEHDLVCNTAFVSEAVIASCNVLFADVVDFLPEFSFDKDTNEHFPHAAKSGVDIQKPIFIHVLL